jgi:predicted component of type VI protein secretion system
MAKLHFSGHLACQTRHAEGLRAILKNYFGIETFIKEFIGQWITLPDSIAVDWANRRIRLRWGSMRWWVRRYGTASKSSGSPWAP